MRFDLRRCAIVLMACAFPLALNPFRVLFRSQTFLAHQSIENTLLKAKEQGKGMAVKENSVSEAVVSNVSLNVPVVYSKARHDRSGAYILDVIMAHAHAYRHGYIYGGACGKDANERRHTVRALIAAMGLDDIFAVTCPKENHEQFCPPISSDKSVSPRTIPKEDYFKHDLATLAKNGYLLSLGKAMQAKGIKYKPSSEGRKVIALHVRRGDVSPCLKADRLTTRYTTNSLYLELIEQNIKRILDETGEKPRVVVYSETKSPEPWDKFIELGYEMRLDWSLEETWRGLAFESDVLILSKSTFSNVPAILRSALDTVNQGINRAVIVYSRWCHKPLEEWEVVGEQLRLQGEREALKMFEKCPTQAHPPEDLD